MRYTSQKRRFKVGFFFDFTTKLSGFAFREADSAYVVNRILKGY